MAQRKLWAQELQAQFGVSIAKSCQVVKMSRKAYYYKPKRTDDSDIIEVLNNIVEKRKACAETTRGSTLQQITSWWVGPVRTKTTKLISKY